MQTLLGESVDQTNPYSPIAKRSQSECEIALWLRQRGEQVSLVEAEFEVIGSHSATEYLQRMLECRALLPRCPDTVYLQAMHLTLTVNQVMARWRTNKEGENRASPPVVRHFQQSVPTSLIGINRQQEQTARMAPVEISSCHTFLRRTAVVRDLRAYVWKRGFSKADKHPCGRDCWRAF